MADAGDTVNTAGSLETRLDAGPSEARLWLDAIDLTSREEKDWRKSAEEAVQDYRDGKRMANSRRPVRRFNILFSNTETLAPALFNAPPIADVRRRFSDDDEAGRIAAQVLERSLTYCVDEGDQFSDVLGSTVKDILLAGRGVARVKYMPHMDPSGQQVVHQEVYPCVVPWDDFRRGPAKTWRDVQWIAFRHRLTRDELVKLSPTIGPKMDLDAQVAGSGDRPDDGHIPPDLFRRGTVWEIWDKEQRRVLFVAETWSEEPLTIVPDPLGLAEFYPIPKPIYAVETSDTMVPVEPYRLYKDQAHELDVITRRISGLVAALRWRGAYVDPQMGDFLARFKDLQDGDMAPLDNPAAVIQGGSIEQAFWFMPIDQAAKVMAALIEAREQVKQTIYEVTGISDILRGASEPGETATAQNIKTQWGSLRVQKLQNDVARHARDLLRLMAEIIAEKFDPAVISMMAGVQIPPQVAELLKNDTMRRFRVEIETDSTIRADVKRQQENIAGFIAGFGQFIQAVGPAVQAGALPMPVVSAMLKSFSRSFKLGRQVEDAIDSMPSELPNQQAGAEQQAAMDAQLKQAELQQNAALEQQKLTVDYQKHTDTMGLEAQKHTDTMGLEWAKLQGAQMQHQDKTGLERERMAVEADQFGADHSLKSRDTAVKERPAEAMEQQESAVVAGIQQIAAASDITAAASATVAGAAKAMAGAVQVLTEAAQAMTAPKRVIRDQNGRVAGVETIQ